jgi:hypothetical protein
MTLRRITSLLRESPEGDLPPLRRIASSLLEVTLVTGVLLRTFRALVLNMGTDPVRLWGGFALGMIFLVAMLTAHVSHYHVRQWLWRVPAFAVLEATAEMLMSLVLIALHREPWGTVRADFHDWPALAADVLVLRLLLLCTFGLVLAAVVQSVRYAMLRHQHRL